MVSGKKSLDETHPHLADQWADERDISTVTFGSDYIASWECPEHQHAYSASVSKRASRNQGCPYCSGAKVLYGFNDCGTQYPSLVDSWAQTNDRSIFEVLPKSHYKAEWICEQGHLYSSPVSRQTAGHGCPYCAGNKVLAGYNDLSATHPEVAAEWDDTKDITTITRWSSYKAQWRCSEGHPAWAATVSNRAHSKNRCPYCSGRLAVPGQTDIATTHPELIEEWADHKDITEVSAGSTYSALWRCRKNADHLWRAIVNNRTRASQGCPHCAANTYVSAAEQKIYSSIVSLLPCGTDIRQSARSLIPPYEIDIYIPELRIAIEFNGLYWHSEERGKDKGYHHHKFVMCRDKGIQLIQIWEDDYKRNPGLVENMLAHKLSSSRQASVAARKTIFSRINSGEARGFLERYHLQGHHGTASYYALSEASSAEIVSVMGVRYHTKDQSLEISRFASSCIVQGGFSKLLKGTLREEPREVKKIVSYSHNDHSWGEVYQKNGFTKVHDGTPGYFYIANNRREHRLNYSPKRFREREDLIFEEGLSERELAALNGLSRIWDAGSARWEKAL